MVLAMHGKAPPHRGVPEGARVADRGVGEPPRQPERRLGPGGDGQAALEAYGVHGYEVRAYDTRGDALRRRGQGDLQATSAPVILLTWRGAHTWVMTGYRADADPLVFENARRSSGAYILDPWYPRVSSIWGAVRPAGRLPGHGRDAAQLPALEAPRGPLPEIATACSSPSCRPSR